MIDINLVRKNPEAVKIGMKNRGMDPGVVDNFLAVDEKWREVTTNAEALRADKKKLGKGDRSDAKKIKDGEKKLNEDIKKFEKTRAELLEKIPNVPEDRVPVGADESSNVELRKWGDPTKFNFDFKNHADVAGGMIDKERAANVSGSRFSYIFGDLVLLEFAVVKYVIEKLAPHGFLPVLPPALIKSEQMKDMGKTKFIEDGDAYYIPEDDLYLVGTAEDTIGPIHMNEIIPAERLPVRYVGFSTAFRREAGAYGKDMKGIFRLHQFDKVEMFSFTRPEDSVAENDFLLERQEEIVKGLDLPYRIVHICTGDMGFTATNQYDVEIWLPSENKYRESHSCSNTTDFQARGLNVKYRRKDGKSEFVHMLNATGAAMRILAYILENNQTKEGAVKVPKALRDYVGKSEITAPKES